jgi:hypothetical protein
LAVEVVVLPSDDAPLHCVWPILILFYPVEIMRLHGNILHLMAHPFDGADTLGKECTSGNTSVPYPKVHDTPSIIY